MSCEVCNGQGDYPIINRGGRTLYFIECPECLGNGLSDEEFALAQRHRLDLSKYEAAMAKMRGQES